jgi:ATP-binding cassette subfamily B protein
VDRERVRAAAQRVHADGFISRLPAGYDEEVRERGSNFSMGERQLLSFARAVAFDPAVLVLDEATASVDPDTESKIQSALGEVLLGRTSIIIAHRLVTVRGVDRILVLHHGELTEQGSHDELLQLDGGIYRTLHELQTASP